MAPTRFPSLAHWGAFTALVENGRLVGCEPFARDPAPSNMIDAMPEMVHSPLRIARPAIREGWRDGKPRTGADSYREVSWDEALDTIAAEVKRVRESYGNTSILGGSYGWASAGRVHHARKRRTVFDQPDRHADRVESVHEVRGAVEGIDEPSRVGLLATGFLAVHRKP